MLIDEVQRVPDCWLAIKNLVSNEPRAGCYLLTSSARLLGLRSLLHVVRTTWPERAEVVILRPCAGYIG